MRSNLAVVLQQPATQASQSSQSAVAPKKRVYIMIPFSKLIDIDYVFFFILIDLKIFIIVSYLGETCWIW